MSCMRQKNNNLRKINTFRSGVDSNRKSIKELCDMMTLPYLLNGTMLIVYTISSSLGL